MTRQSYRSHFKLASSLNIKQNRLTMKTPLLVLVGTTVVALAACVTSGNHGGLNMTDAYIEIRPGTKIDPEGQIQLARILSNYNNKLYWVKNINNKAEVGKLNCVYVDNTFLNEVLQSTYNAGTSYSAIQIGARPTNGDSNNGHHTRNIHHTPNPHLAALHHTPCMHHTPVLHTQLTQADYDKSRALVKEVTPILQKYSHK